MLSPRNHDRSEGSTILDRSETRLLSAQEERETLRALADCKRKLAEALAKIPSAELPDGAEDDPQTLSQYIAAFYAGDGPNEANLGAVFHQYSALRSKLAMANMRLIAHMAKRFRDRGIAYSDLLQDGFCGLLEAIDRFDLGHETKLATYATWWIRQAMQRAVAAGAYPVRLTPRHLRQLARNQEEIDRIEPETASGAGKATDALNAPSNEMIQRIHAATRPSLSLDATFDPDSGFNLLQMMAESEADPNDRIDMDETVHRLLKGLRPREQEVLALRFGLGGQERLSLSQVGRVLQVSKERIRQIQDRAIEKLRMAVVDQKVDDVLSIGG